MTARSKFSPGMWMGPTSLSSAGLTEICQQRFREDLSTYLALCSRIAQSPLPAEVRELYQQGREVIKSFDAHALKDLFQCPITVWVISNCAKLWAKTQDIDADGTVDEATSHAWAEAALHLNRVILGVALMRQIDASLLCIAANGVTHLQPQGLSVPVPNGRPLVSVFSDGTIDTGLGRALQRPRGDLVEQCAQSLCDRANFRVDPYDPLFHLHWVQSGNFPYGVSAKVPDATQLASWVAMAEVNMALLHSLWPEMLDEITHLQSVLVPVFSPQPGLSISLSSDSFWGAILISDADEILFNESLIHEHSHNVMYGLLRRYTFLISGGFDGERHYSPWRPDARPLYGLLHAVYVFSRVCEYYARLIQNRTTSVELQSRLALMQARVEVGCLVLDNSNDLTEDGEALVHAIQSHFNRLRGICQQANMREVRTQLSKHLHDWQIAHPDLKPASAVIEHHMLKPVGATPPTRA